MIVAMTQPSRLYRLVESQLGEPLENFVITRRGDERSWRWISDEIERRTGERLTDEILRRWFADRIVTETRVDNGAAA